MSHPGRRGLDAVDEQPDAEPVVELGVVASYLTLRPHAAAAATEPSAAVAELATVDELAAELMTADEVAR